MEIDILMSERCGPAPDSALVARSGGVAIWHTEKFAPRDVPLWLPPFSWDVSMALYRGFSIDKLNNVLEHGLDVPPRCAFFATGHDDKAWEYPCNRTIAAMLVLDSSQTLPSYARTPAGADDSWQPDKSLYPNTYADDGQLIHTRFEDGRCQHFLNERMYGHWVPGDARDALIAIVLGGPRAVVNDRLKGLQGRGEYGLDLL